MNKENSQEMWTHGSTLSEATRTLHQAEDTVRHQAHRALQLPDTAAPDETSALEAARAITQEYLQQQAPRATRAAAELLGFSNLWFVAAKRMRQLASLQQPPAYRELAEGVRILQHGVRTRREFIASLAEELAGLLGRIEALRRGRGARPGELTSCLDALATALAELVAASQAVHRAWESLAAALDTAAARLDCSDAGASAWLAEHLDGADFGWNRAHSTAQRLQTAVPPTV